MRWMQICYNAQEEPKLKYNFKFFAKLNKYFPIIIKSLYSFCFFLASGVGFDFLNSI